MSKTKLYTLQFLVKCLKFEQDANTERKVTASLNFLNYHQQIIFDPVILPATGGGKINVGKSFTFGLDRNMECELSKEFVIVVNLEQTEPESSSSEAQIDITRIFLGVFRDLGLSNAKDQVCQ